MIGKIKKGKSFGGCIRYVMGKDNATIIDSDGVLLENIREITDSFNYQRELNPKIKQPVGHIALSFKPEDKALLTDEFMAKIAREYMELMGIKNTQFILVRHHNTDNPHCHLVYNRIGYDGKVISSQSDYKRNEIATKLLKDKYGLTYAEGKGKTNVEKLHASERVKYEIFNAVKAALKHSKTWKEFNDYLLRRGIRLEFVKRTMEIKKPEDIQGIRFTKDGQGFTDQPGVQLCQAECPIELEAFGIPTGIRTQGAAKDTGRKPSFRKYGTGTVQSKKRHRSRRAVTSGRTLAQTQEKEKEERIRAVACPFFIQIIHEH